LKNIEIPHVPKVIRKERRRLLDFGLDGELLSAQKLIDWQVGQQPDCRDKEKIRLGAEGRCS
jgi:hypothetical protein